MKDYKVSAQSLISWLRKSKKSEKVDFEILRFQLEPVPASERTVGQGLYGYSSRE
jgi:hypothetical protein